MPSPLPSEPPDLLAWSPALDLHLLAQPFRSFTPTTSTSTSLPLLYKLAASSATSQLFFILLDPSTCTVFSEGVSSRTLSRRVQLHTPAHTQSQTQTEHDIDQIVEAIHGALSPTLAVHYDWRRTIALEATRFSASLFIDVKEGGGEDFRFKTTFDLDPLDAAAAKTFLEGHFIAPLLDAAAQVAGQHSSSTEAQAKVEQPTLDCLAGLALKRRGLSHDHLPSPKRRQLPPASRNASLLSLPTPGQRLAGANVGGRDDGEQSDESDLVFFGPRPTNRATRQAIKRENSTPAQGNSRLSSSPPLFTQTEGETQPARTGQASGSSQAEVASWRISAPPDDDPDETLPSPSAVGQSGAPPGAPPTGVKREATSQRLRSPSPDSSSSSEEEPLLPPSRSSRGKAEMQSQQRAADGSTRRRNGHSSQVAPAASQENGTARSDTVRDTPTPAPTDTSAGARVTVDDMPTPTPGLTQTQTQSSTQAPVRTAEQRAREQEKRREIQEIKKRQAEAVPKRPTRAGRSRF